jgi:predicted RND superfamily exporter protein
MVDYLPEDSQSTIALKIMEEEFTQAVPNARVMLYEVTLQEALEYKEKLEAIDGVTEVIWLDDVINLKEPIEMADTDTVKAYYKDSTALISVTITEGKEVATCDSIYELIGEENALAGNAVNMATAQKLSASESFGAFLILIPLIILILLLSTSSWVEPLFFLIAIGISILLNMGSNMIFGEVSFMTQSISPILQMAVSLDYAIFLLHSFEDYRKKTDDVNEAMQLAMRRAFPAIIASAATTLFGFLALMFMNFRIGSDLGINLVKGIVFSFITVMVFLPAFTLFCYKWIDRTRHKEILPSFQNIGKLIVKLKIPALVLIAIIILPSFLAQSKTDFLYGTGSLSSNSRSGQDEIKISDKFGTSIAIVLLVPKGEAAKEQLLCIDLEELDHVNQVISYASMVGATIPDGYLDSAITNQFYSKNYSRIILYTDTKEEGDIAFTLVDQVQSTARKYYGNTVYSCGQSITLYDMKNVVSADTIKVNLIAILAIALVLLLTFRSISIPILLLITIEAAIWINLSTPYFLGNSLCYIGYLVINTVQLGATVDYAILLTDNYKRNRQLTSKREAIKNTLGETFHSILISAVILSSAGFCLGLTSSNPIVSELGMLLGRGTLLSMAMVVCVLPQLLLLFDPIIKKTTLKANFYKEK